MKILLTTDWYQPYKKGNVVYIGSVGTGKIYPDARLGMVMGNRYMKQLVAWKPDIVHSQCEFSTFLFARYIAKKAQAPLIHTYHTVYEDFTHYFSPNIRFGRYMAAQFSKWILKKTQAVIAPTEKTRKLLLSYGVEMPVYTVPTGLDLVRFEAPADRTERELLRKRYGIDRDAQVLLYLGRLAKEKNIEELLRLIKEDGNKKRMLLLVGDGPYREVLENLSYEWEIAERVIFTGMVPPNRIVSYYRMGDVFVSASQSETQGLTYLEAMASGLPLLCRADPCLTELIEDGVNGFTYETDAEFGKKLECLSSDAEICKKIGECAANTIKKRYSMQTFAAAALRIYRLLLAG